MVSEHDSTCGEADVLLPGGGVGGVEAAAQAGVGVQESGSSFLEGGDATMLDGGDATSGRADERDGRSPTTGAQDDDAFAGQQPAQCRRSASSFRSSIAQAESDLVEVEETFKMWLSRSRRLLEDMKQLPPDVASDTAAQSVPFQHQKSRDCVFAFMWKERPSRPPWCCL